MSEELPGKSPQDGLENLSIEEKQKLLSQTSETGSDSVQDFLKELEAMERKEVPDTENPTPAPLSDLDKAMTPKETEREAEQTPNVLEPEPEPEPEATSNISQESAVPEERVPAWRNDPRWVELEELRKEAAKAEFHKEAIYGEELKKRYITLKDALEEEIKNETWAGIDSSPTPDEEKALNTKIRHTVFEELVIKEDHAYIDALKAHRRETWKGSAMETAKNLLGTKAVKWYLGLSRTQRIALNFGAGSLIGLAAGAAIAPGMVGVTSYLAWRAGRAGLSGLSGAKVGEWANKKWSAEELKQAEEREIEDLKNSELSREEQSKGLLDIEKRYKKEKMKMTLKRIGTTAAASAVTGALAGLAENVAMGAGGSAESVLESKGGRTPTIQEDRLPPRKSFEPAPAKPPTPTPETTILKPEFLTHEVKTGDSAWKILRETLDHNEKFTDMTEAQKTFVLSALTNKILKNPGDYGLGRNGVIHVGDKTDFTRLFADSKEIGAVFEKAQQTIAAGSPKEISILANNEKIASWVKTHPETELTDEKVSEILSEKPKTEIAPEPEPKPEPEPEPKPEPENMPEVLTPEDNTKPGGLETETPNALDDEKDARREEETIKEIEKAKSRLAELESTQGRNPNLERSLISDTQLVQGVEEAFRSEINSIYGKSGFLGMGKIAGVDTKEWGEMARLPASKVVEYYTGDSTKSGLTVDAVEKLAKSKLHSDLMKQMTGLMEQTKGAVKPFENETMERFIKRLGGYVLKTHTQNLQKAA